MYEDNLRFDLIEKCGTCSIFFLIFGVCQTCCTVYYQDFVLVGFTTVNLLATGSLNPMMCLELVLLLILVPAWKANSSLQVDSCSLVLISPKKAGTAIHHLKPLTTVNLLATGSLNPMMCLELVLLLLLPPAWKANSSLQVDSCSLVLISPRKAGTGDSITTC